MLKIIRLYILAQKIFKTNNNEIIMIDNSKINKTAQNLFKFKNSKNIKHEILIYINNRVIKNLSLYFLTLK